jgi:hypothetical protein
MATVGPMLRAGALAACGWALAACERAQDACDGGHGRECAAFRGSGGAVRVSTGLVTPADPLPATVLQQFGAPAADEQRSPSP